MYLKNSRIEGEIPRFMFDLPLTAMQLNTNLFSGAIPDLFDKLPDLRVLCLEKNIPHKEV